MARRNYPLLGATPASLDRVVFLDVSDTTRGPGGTFKEVTYAELTSGLGGSLSDGDKGDVTVSGSGATWTIDSNAVSYAKMQDVSATQRAIGRNTAGSGDPEEVTASQLLDWIGSTRGSVLYRGSGGWAILSPGTAGYLLASGGAGADPSYAAPDVTKAIKTSAQTGIGTSFTDVSSLGISVVSGSWYEFTGLIVAQANSVATGIDVAVNGPAATSVCYTQHYWTSATAMTDRGATAYDNDTSSGSSQGANDRIFQVRGVVLPSADGTLIPRIKAETGGTCDVQAGSCFVVRKLN